MDRKIWSILIILVVRTHLAHSDIAEDFSKSEIVGDILDTAPTEQLTVKYELGEISPGQVLTPTDTKDPPEVSWNSDSTANYTLIMLDPDAKSRKVPTYRSWLHWLVINIPGKSVSDGALKSTYRRPGPPPETGLHRYVFLVFKQTQDVTITTDYSLMLHRPKFIMRDFIKTHKLESTPVAGNYFEAQNPQQ